MQKRTNSELEQARLDMEAAKTAWKTELEACRDPSATEKAYGEAKAKEATLGERKTIIDKTVATRRIAAQLAWDRRRDDHYKERARTAESRIHEARTKLAATTDAFWVRVFNEETRMLLLLKIGVGGPGSPGICPLF
jgi:hypothetical protein